MLPGALVIATFSKNMKEAETEAAFSLHLGDETGPLVAGTGDLDAADQRTMTFDPTNDLTPGQRYTAVVEGGASGAQATDDLYLLNDRVWSFWVITRPAVLLQSPADGAVGVSRTAPIKVVFSKDVDPTTVSTTTFLVEDSSGTPVVGVVTYNDTTFTATFDPDADLVFAAYDVTVKAGAAGVKDPDGIQMAADVTWSFTTVPSLKEPVAVNNKITPTSTGPVTIFIPQPPAEAGGADARVTVQVFTPTGKQVATMVNARRYSDLESELPLLWYGVNGRARTSAQVCTSSGSAPPSGCRTLKVMVVR